MKFSLKVVPPVQTYCSAWRYEDLSQSLDHVMMVAPSSTRMPYEVLSKSCTCCQNLMTIA